MNNRAEVCCKESTSQQIVIYGDLQPYGEGVNMSSTSREFDKQICTFGEQRVAILHYYGFIGLSAPFHHRD